MDAKLNSTFNHLFRSEYAKLVSHLTSKFGTSKIDAIEDAVQEALLKAMQMWSFKEIPDNPGKWLYRVSYNSIIDHLRRANKTVMFNPEIMNDYLEEDYVFDDNKMDDQLKMIFACCHPSMTETDRMMLSLKLLCGFSNKEIGRALFKNDDAVKKGLTRAKQKFKTEIGELSLPTESELPSRLDSVLQVVYLIFNNGYTAYEGEHVLKKDVCEEALRLAGMLYVNPNCSTSEVKALIALMSFNLSRFDARTSAKGDLIPLKDQDRTLWDMDLIELGSRFIAESSVVNSYSNYHLQAAIAREYSISSSYETIDWEVILAVYSVLVKQSNSSIAALNRLVVLSKVKGDKLALKELLELDHKELSGNHLYYSIKGEFEKNLSMKSYKGSILKAISLTNNSREKEFLRLKLEA